MTHRGHEDVVGAPLQVHAAGRHSRDLRIDDLPTNGAFTVVGIASETITPSDQEAVALARG
jgi:hypothetical protein